MKIEWKDIPETYWPDTDRPWRVTWALGAFEDFATREEARKCYRTIRREHPDWPVDEPFNVVTVR